MAVLQDFDTLKKGFIKLRDKYTQSTAKVSALEDELSICRGESVTQVTALQEQLKAQIETAANQVADAKSTSRTVRPRILKNSSNGLTDQWICRRCTAQHIFVILLTKIFSTDAQSTCWGG